MNKSDIKLIVIFCFVVGILFILLGTFKSKGEVAEVFYEDKLILSIDLSIDKEYTVDGELGDVVIEVKDGKVRVKSENSPKNLCSKEGYTNSSLKPIVCLPNKITIKISNKSDIDGVVY